MGEWGHWNVLGQKASENCGIFIFVVIPRSVHLNTCYGLSNARRPCHRVPRYQRRELLLQSLFELNQPKVHFNAVWRWDNFFPPGP